MSPAAPAAAPAQAKDGRHNRSFKNYLLDARFQLKYTGMIVGVSLAIALILGIFLYRTSGEVVNQSQKVVDESKKVSDIVKMNIKNDPIYGDSPELATAFNQSATEQDNKIVEQQQSLIRQQHTMLLALVGGLTLMVTLIGLLGIYFTHKVVGPIYKMKGLLRQVGDGKMTFYGKLRKGDELQEFFEVFQTMVDKLKARQAGEIELLEGAITDAKASGASEAAIAKIVTVRDEMQRALEK